MRILQINNCHFIRGGADIVYLNTIELLKKNGHDVACFSMLNEKNLPCRETSYFPASINYRNLPTLGKLKSIKSFIDSKESSIKLDSLIKEFKPDIAHIHLFMGGLTSSILKVLKANQIPIVHTVHDYRLICPAYTLLDRRNNLCELCKDKFYLRCAFKKCSGENKYSHSIVLSLDAYYRRYIVKPIDYIDNYIFVSDFSRKKHIEFNNMFASKSGFIYNFTPKLDFRYSNRGDYFLYFGRLSREKGIELLINAIGKLNLKLKIVGTGPLYDEFKKFSTDKIEILGFKQGNELLDLIAKSSFVIVPSECYENNPLTIIEAFSLGKPVIGSDIGGIPELLKEGRGLLFNAKDISSLTSALQQADSLTEIDYIEMSQLIHEFYDQNFTESIHYHKLMTIYNTLYSKQY